MITTLTNLLRNFVFMKLNALQCAYDSKDSAMKRSHFTRSPLQAFAFLVAYAALDPTKKEEVFHNLKTELFDKEDLDKLIKDMQWSDLLNKEKNKPVEFECTIEVKEPEQFMSDLEKNCPTLFQSLKVAEPEKMPITLKTAVGDEVVFTTKVAQEATWVEPFETNSNYWIVEGQNFLLDKEIIDAFNAAPNKAELKLGGFTIRKNTDKTWNEIEENSKLFLPLPLKEKNREYNIEEPKFVVNTGIYNAFKGLTKVYGLDYVSKIEVRLENSAQFSHVGTRVEQLQEVAMTRGFLPSYPATITVDHVNVLYGNAVLAASFSNTPTEISVTKKIFNIQLFTEENSDQILLTNYALSGEEVLCYTSPQRYTGFIKDSKKEHKQHEATPNTPTQSSLSNRVEIKQQEPQQVNTVDQKQAVNNVLGKCAVGIRLMKDIPLFKNDPKLQSYVDELSTRISEINKHGLNVVEKLEQIAEEISKKHTSIITTHDKIKEIVDNLTENIHFYTIQKKAKADQIIKALHKVPIEERATIHLAQPGSAGYEVLTALAKHRHLGKRGTEFFSPKSGESTENSIIDPRNAAESYKTFMRAMNPAWQPSAPQTQTAKVTQSGPSNR